MPSNEPVEPSATDGSEEDSNSTVSNLKTLYKGVFDNKKEYHLGDFITHKGSLWHCNTKCLGDFNYSNFTLAVKKGEANNVT